MATDCDHCLYNSYDEEFEEYYCEIGSYMDEDDRGRLYDNHKCKYFRPGDEYTIVHKQI